MSHDEIHRMQRDKVWEAKKKTVTADDAWRNAKNLTTRNITMETINKNLVKTHIKQLLLSLEGMIHAYEFIVRSDASFDICDMQHNAISIIINTLKNHIVFESIIDGAKELIEELNKKSLIIYANSIHKLKTEKKEKSKFIVIMDGKEVRIDPNKCITEKSTSKEIIDAIKSIKTKSTQELIWELWPS